MDEITNSNSDFQLAYENCFNFSSSEDERCSCENHSLQDELNLTSISSPSCFPVAKSHDTEMSSFIQKASKKKENCDHDDECNDEDDPLSDYRNSVWKKKSTNLLLRLCKEHKNDFCDYSKKKKYIWETIAEKLRLHGYAVTADTCDTKWRNMLKTYRKTLKYNEQPGILPRKCPFFDEIKEVLREHSIKKQSKELPTQSRQEKFGYLVHKRTGVIWDTKSLKYLISAYKEHKNDFSDDRIKKRYVWNKVSDFMNKKGCIVPPDSCEAKWKNLLRKFKHTLNEKGQPTAETLRSPLYQEMMEVMSESQCNSDEDHNTKLSNSAQQRPERRKPTGFMWESQSTKLLISLYAEKSMTYTEQKKSKLWSSIAEAMCKHGYSVTPSTCDAKWRKMLKIYKSALQYNRRTGNIPSKCWFFNEMKEMSSQFVFNTKTKSSKKCKNNLVEKKLHKNLVGKQQNSYTQGIGENRKMDIIGWLDNRKAEQDKREKEKMDVLLQMHKERMELMGVLIQMLKT